MDSVTAHFGFCAAAQREAQASAAASPARIAIPAYGSIASPRSFSPATVPMKVALPVARSTE